MATFTMHDVIDALSDNVLDGTTKSNSTFTGTDGDGSVTESTITDPTPETEYYYTYNSGDETISIYQLWASIQIQFSGVTEFIFNSKPELDIVHPDGNEYIYLDTDSRYISYVDREIFERYYVNSKIADRTFYEKYFGKRKRRENLEQRLCNADYQRRENVHLQQHRKLKICSGRYRSHR